MNTELARGLRRALWGWLRGALALALAGCAVGPEYQKPEAELASKFRNGAELAEQLARVPSYEAWWQGFGDPTLTRLMSRVAAQNLDLSQAGARIDQSRAAVRGAGAALRPTGQARISSTSVKQSLQDPTTVISRESPKFEREYEQNQIGLVASWELDLFGSLRRSREASQAELESVVATGEAVRVSVTAEAVDAYMLLRGQQARRDVARRQLENEERLQRLVAQRVTEGVSAERESHQTLALVERIRASIPTLNAEVEAQLQRLNVLTGGLQEAEREELALDAPIPRTPGALLPGEGPANLLRRRPDVIAAERRIAAANARIGASMAEYYPKFSLSALLGYSSIESGQLLTGDANQRQFGLGLRWRLFDFGRVDAEVEMAKGREAEALLAYRAVILKASAEVETSLSQQVEQRRRIFHLQRELDELTLSRRQALSAYDGGAVSLIEVLDADRQLLSVDDEMAVTRLNAARAFVATFRALGGGWQSERSE